MAPAPNIYCGFMEKVGADWFLGADVMDRSISALAGFGNSRKGRRVPPREGAAPLLPSLDGFPVLRGVKQGWLFNAYPTSQRLRPSAVAGSPRCSFLCSPRASAVGSKKTFCMFRATCVQPIPAPEQYPRNVSPRSNCDHQQLLAGCRIMKDDSPSVVNTFEVGAGGVVLRRSLLACHGENRAAFVWSRVASTW